jgi:hypothetical protein
MFGLGAWLGESALMTSPAGPIIKMFWKPLLGALLVVVLFSLHQCEVRKFKSKVTADVNAGWQKRLDAEHAAALTWKHKFDQSQAAMALAIRTRHEDTLRADAALADAIKLRGPGAARCGQGTYSSAAAGAGRHVAGSRQADAPVVGLPDQERVDLIGLPFTGTVNGFQRCDANLSEVKSWHEWYDQLVKSWPKPSQ